MHRRIRKIFVLNFISIKLYFILSLVFGLFKFNYNKTFLKFYTLYAENQLKQNNGVKCTLHLNAAFHTAPHKICVFQWMDFHTSKIINMIYSIHLEIEVYERCWIVKGVYAACCCVYTHTNTNMSKCVKERLILVRSITISKFDSFSMWK